MFFVLLDLFLSYVKIGFFGFGGGYAMLALMEHEIIRVHGWMTMPEFIDIIAVAEMTPGPIAINSATFVGYNVAGLPGATLATLGVILPSLLLIIPAAKIVSYFYQHRGLQRALTGIHPAVIALIGFAAIVVGESAMVDLKSWAITAGCLALLFLRGTHPLLLIALGAVAGLILYA